jgi:single-stranded-DNA-specific exonuclease
VKRVWALQSSSGQVSEEISKSLQISKVVSDILVQRNLREPEKVIEFLYPSLLNVSSPFCFKHMKKVIQRLTLALEKSEKVLVYGDYDVDGVTSTALVYKVLTDLGFQAVAYIPHRQDEGYGLHEEAIKRAAKTDVKVIVTVDCGVTAVSEVNSARDLGIDVIITDHHEPPEHMPDAFAILNPKIEDSGYPFRDLAGVGVAFKLAQALLQSLGNIGIDVRSEISLLDLVALGTIADLVPLVGENRVFVYHGLLQMENTHHPGLEALLEECGLKDKSLKAGQIGFMVAPRINAAGRMDSAREGLELLLTENEERAEELARLLTKENQSRQETEKEILAEAISFIEQGPLPRVIVLSSKHWHHGVIGIVASRLVERYYRPVFMIAEEGNEAKGSARGIPGYPVLDQLKTQADLLMKFGGHKAAAGFSLLTDNIERMRRGLNIEAETFEDTLFQEVLHIDRKISLAEVSAGLLRELEQLAPFGFGNPGPVLAIQGIKVHSLNTVGKERNHLKFRFGAKGELEGIAFRLGDRLSELNQAANLDAAFSLDWNTFQGQDKVQLMIKDIQLDVDWFGNKFDEDESQESRNQIAAAQESLDIKWQDLGPSFSEEEFVKGIKEFQQLGIDWLSDLDRQDVQEERIRKLCGYLTREELIQFYRELRSKAEETNPFQVSAASGDNHDFILALNVFEELGLIRCLGGGEKITLEWIPVQGKLNLDTSIRYRYSKERYEKALNFQRKLMANPWIRGDKLRRAARS